MPESADILVFPFRIRAPVDPPRDDLVSSSVLDWTDDETLAVHGGDMLEEEVDPESPLESG